MRFDTKIALVLLSTILFQIISAQNPITLTPLTGNPGVYNSESKNHKQLYPAGGMFFFEWDTVGLPFVDDFSRDKYISWRIGDYPNTRDTITSNFLITGFTIQPDSIWYSFTQTFDYQIVGGNLDSTATQLLEIVIFDTLFNPFIPFDTIYAYPYRQRKVINNQGGLDSIFVRPPDGKLYFKQKFYVILKPNGDKRLWVDRFTFRNNNLPVAPPTFGVATFDGINELGFPYNFTNPDAYGVADYLTSKPIDLSGLTPADSVILSFFYQPQGLGFFPSARDSLVLEFKAPGNRRWEHQWSVKGERLKPFEQVFIPITAQRFLQRGFQFRFKNYATLSANQDHWHIDYVILDKNRSVNDTLINDVAFVSSPQPILREFQQMPYNQFLQTEVNQKWEMLMTNLSDIEKRITYEHYLLDRNLDSLTAYPFDAVPGDYDTSFIKPFFSDGYNDNDRHLFPSFSYNFDNYPGGVPFQDSIDFTVLHRIVNLDSDDNPDNDTVMFHQKFHNYFAYDDGSAETAMFLGGSGSLPPTATVSALCQFKLNFPDTLRAIQFYFNPIQLNHSNRSIRLLVYNGSQPTNLLFESQPVNISYPQFGNNWFTTYVLEQPVVLPPGEFYIGWSQPVSLRINLGYDRNTDSRERMWFNFGVGWNRSQVFIDDPDMGGSFMMRPVLGKPVTGDMFVGLDPQAKTAPQAEVSIFPNPAQDFLNYRINGSEEIFSQGINVQIFDLSGRIVKSESQFDYAPLNVSGLKNGMYIVRFTSLENGSISSHKFTISR